MIKYIQNKSIDLSSFEEILKLSTKYNQFTNRGPAKLLLESHLKEVLELPEDKSVICTSNGTLALHAILFFYKKRNKNKFITPSYTFPSSVVSNFKTKVIDIDLQTFSFKNDEEMIKKYDGLIVTNLFGTYPCNLEKLICLANKHNTAIILDNASSPMTKINGLNICCYGDMSFGSLHHTKFMGFGEGGFIVTDSKYEEELNQILGFGFDGLSKKRISHSLSSNFKISDVASASILQHLKRYDMSKHIEVQDGLIEQISQIAGLEIFNYHPGVVYGNLPLIYDNNINTDFFRDSGLEAQKYYYPLKRHKNSFKLYNRIINLPLHCDLQEYEVEKIIKIVRKSVK